MSRAPAWIILEHPLTLRPGNLSSDAACPCVLFALRLEAMFFRRMRPRRRRFLDAPVPAAFHGDGPRNVLLLETGVGAAAMERALAWLLSGPRLDDVPYRPTLIVSAGFSGALTSGLHVGDLIVAEDVCDDDGTCRPATWPITAVSYPRSRLLTIRNIVASPEEKRRLGERSGAVAVDMETAIVANLCSKAGVPFGCLRAISDDADTFLSESLLAVLQGGRVRPARLLAAVLQRPSLIAELMRLGAHTRKAARRLAVGLEELLGSG
jgi:adenosylhomocysteine nucleosidase